MPEPTSHHSSAAGDQSFLRRLNAAAVLAELRESGPQTLTEIAERTGLSRPTAQGATEEVIEQGWVEQLPPESGGVGRPARRYRFRAEAGFVLGLDIGTDRALALVADLDGHVRGTNRAGIRADAEADDRLATARQVAKQALMAADLTQADLLAVGIGTPGVVDASGQVAIASVLPDWEGRSLIDDFSGTFDCRILVENDANLATLAERWTGVAADASDVVGVLVGHRIGAGVLINGQLHRGHSGAAGEVAFMDPLGIRTDLRRLRGLTEPAEDSKSRSSAWGEAADPAGDEVVSLLATVRQGQGNSAKSTSRELIRDFARDLSLGIAAMTLTVDPELVVICGGISEADEFFLVQLRRFLSELSVRTPRVRVSALGDESVAMGALRRALDDVEQRLFAS